MSFDLSSWIVPVVVTIIALAIGRLVAARATHGGNVYGLQILRAFAYGAAVVAWFLFCVLNFV